MAKTTTTCELCGRRNPGPCRFKAVTAHGFTHAEAEAISDAAYATWNAVAYDVGPSTIAERIETVVDAHRMIMFGKLDRALHDRFVALPDKVVNRVIRPIVE